MMTYQNMHQHTTIATIAIIATTTAALFQPRSRWAMSFTSRGGRQGVRWVVHKLRPFKIPPSLLLKQSTADTVTVTTSVTQHRHRRVPSNTVQYKETHTMNTVGCAVRRHSSLQFIGHFHVHRSPGCRRGCGGVPKRAMHENSVVKQSKRNAMLTIIKSYSKVDRCRRIFEEG